jgi:twitching motility protein PilT
VALVPSLLSAIVRVDGDALVLHAGERPYVVGPSGQTDVASRPLTLDAMIGIVGELLPAEARRTLDELGGVSHELQPSAEFAGDRFLVVAARGANDVWIEIRRTRKGASTAPSRTPAEAGGPSASSHRGESEPAPAVVLPLARNHVRGDSTARTTQSLHIAGIDRLLRIAAARGASTLYLTSQGRPSIRVDGEISALDGEAVLSEADVEALILGIIPERSRESLRGETGAEWICDVADVGRVRCVTFSDHRGAGGIFRMIPARAISAEQLGLSREIQGLCAEADGLVLVTGPRQSGKSTLISAFVDLVNRTRSDHVITLESQIKFVHENRLSLVSQREVRGDDAELLAAARAMLREDPDVLVIEALRSAEIAALALDAARSGRLVIGALTARTTTEAIDRIVDQMQAERRPQMQLGLAQALRGVVGQVLLRKTGGGRVAAREVLLNTSAVANLIADGKTSQLPMALDSGRKHGMVPLNDALVSFVQSGVVDSREAYRQASDRPGFLALLKRQGIDTSFVERLA